LERIQSNIKTVTEILDDFLSLSRLEEGKLENKPSLIDIEIFTRDIIDDLVGYKKVEQKIHYSHLSDHLRVNLDSKLLKNIIINLLSNAIKYSQDDGGIYILTEISSKNLKITVKDEGIGIPKKDQKFLFDRFFRATNVYNIKGTGLGLNIVKQYVDIMNGNITFESKEGKGTSFFIVIPLKTLGLLKE
jgi:signal transduction histidine kinase